MLVAQRTGSALLEDKTVLFLAMTIILSNPPGHGQGKTHTPH
jgi:hypothetical protein